MKPERESSFYLMVFLCLLASGSVFSLASAVTMDRVRGAALPRYYVRVLRKAITDSFPCLGAPARAGGDIPAELRSLAAKLAGKISGAGGASDGAGRGPKPRSPSDDGTYNPAAGQDENLFNLALDYSLRLRFGGGRRQIESDPSGDWNLPGSLPPLHKGKSAGRNPGPGPAAQTDLSPGPLPRTNGPDDDAAEKAPRTAAAPRGAPQAGGSSLDLAWSARPGGGDPGADDEGPKFSLNGLNAGSIKKEVPASGVPQAGRQRVPGAASGGPGSRPSLSSPSSPTGAALQAVADKIQGKKPSADQNPVGGGVTKPKPPGPGPAASAPRPVAGAPELNSQKPGSSEDAAPSAAITDTDREKIEAVVRRTIGSLESGYGALTSLNYTDCAESRLCAEHGLAGGFYTLRLQSGAEAKFSVKRDSGEWVNYTIDFSPPPEQPVDDVDGKE